MQVASEGRGRDGDVRVPRREGAVTGTSGSLGGKAPCTRPSLALWVVLVLDPRGRGSVPALDGAVLQSTVARPRAEAWGIAGACFCSTWWLGGVDQPEGASAPARLSPLHSVCQGLLPFGRLGFKGRVGPGASFRGMSLPAELTWG